MDCQSLGPGYLLLTYGVRKQGGWWLVVPYPEAAGGVTEKDNHHNSTPIKKGNTQRPPQDPITTR